MVRQEMHTREETTISDPNTQRVVRKTEVVMPSMGGAQPQDGYKTKKVIFHAYQIIWYILGVVEVLLAFRILLLLFGADTKSGFTNFIYAISDPLALPFAGIFGITSTSGSVFEWSTFIAMIVYAVVAYGIVALIRLVKPTNPVEIEETVDNQ